MHKMSAVEICSLFENSQQDIIQAFSDSTLQNNLDALQEQICSSLPLKLITGGAGTSGRIAILIENNFSTSLREKGITCKGWIAGGEKAITTAIEGAEDNANTAATEIRELLQGDNSAFIGISCGLSAPAVAAGLVEAQKCEALVAVIGMNSTDQARDNKEQGIDGKSFRDILSELKQFEKFYALTPQVGPEILAGSSRLKGGTATYILLEALTKGILTNIPASIKLKETIERLRDQTLQTNLPELIEIFSKTLLEKKPVYYYASSQDLFDAAMLDASECRPTFGDVNQLVQALNRDSLQTKESALYITLNQTDYELLSEQKREVYLLECQDFLEAKLNLNALSTAAFTRAGYVYDNRMINVQLSNTKLWTRAIGIIMDITGVSEEIAERSLFTALHKDTDVPYQLTFAQMSAEEKAMLCAKSTDGTVPLAVLLASGRSFAEAEEIINSSTPVAEYLK